MKEKMQVAITVPQGGNSFSIRGLVAASAASLGFVVARSVYVGHPSFLFLCWNLLLGALPLLFSVVASANVAAGKGKGRVLFWGVLWLVFFPNAPYIITDFVHLGTQGGVPVWFDIVMIGSFAWTGMMFGFQSLALMHGFVKKKYGHKVGWSFAVGVLLASSYGIYLGRFHRWNSWDIFVQPVAVIADIIASVAHPYASMQGLALTAGMGVFLLLAYYSVATLHGWGEANPSGHAVIQKNSSTKNIEQHAV